ncbi:MAG: aminotransferase class V-fold PLP-dependent enzyme [Acetobacteraceae bacterium]
MIHTRLGLAVRSAWGLDPDFLTVNHGSFGATPRVVLAAQAEWRARMEEQPSRFMRSVVPGALREVADILGRFLGVQGRDLAFIDNATSGCNAVLRSLHLSAGDEVLVLTHGYNAVRNTVRFVAERAGARMTEAAVPFPAPDPDAIVASVEAALTPRTRLAVIDHITSASALVLPVARITAACHAAGVKVLVDGAHAPGQIDLDVAATGADWYTGNCHKWLCAPKGAAFLWAAPDRQDDLHPPVISHGLGQGFVAEFDWTGTRDPTAALSVPDAIEFHQQLGGADMRARNIALAAAATGLLARRLNTEAGAAGTMAAAMGVVRLPVQPGDIVAAMLRERLLAAGTDAPVFLLDGGVWLRLSAFAYNEPQDYAHLADLVTSVMREVAA